MTVTTSSFIADLKPVAKASFNGGGNNYVSLHDKIAEVMNTNDQYEEYVAYSEMPSAVLKPEGQSVEFFDGRQFFTTRIRNATYAIGFNITLEAQRYNKGIINWVAKRSMMLKRSLLEVKDDLVTQIFNRGFNSSYTYGDGKEFFSTAHPDAVGGTYQNKLTTDVDFGEAGLEQALIDLRNMKNFTGLYSQLKAERLMIPTQTMWDSIRILKSDQRPGTANNDINALRYGNILQNDAIINERLTDTDAWFVKTNLPAGEGVIMQISIPDTLDTDSNSDTFSTKFTAHMACGVGVVDPHCYYASTGA